MSWRAVACRCPHPRRPAPNRPSGRVVMSSVPSFRSAPTARVVVSAGEDAFTSAAGIFGAYATDGASYILRAPPSRGRPPHGVAPGGLLGERGPAETPR